MLRARFAVYALTALTASSVALVPIPLTVELAASSSIGFGVPTIVDPIHNNGEPDIAIDPQRRSLASGPTGTGTQRSTWFGSVAGSHTYSVPAQSPVPSAIMDITEPAPADG